MRQTALRAGVAGIRLTAAMLMCAAAQAQDSRVDQIPAGFSDRQVGTSPERRVLFGRIQSSAGDETIVTDRPDFTEASSTVGQGTLQLETGYTYGSDHDGTIRTNNHSYPEALFRYGIGADWLELRLATNVSTEKVGGPSHSGLEDLYLGAKLALTLQDGLLPEMAVVPQMTIPTGHHAFTGDKVLPGLNWLYGWDWTDCLSAAGSTQFNCAVDDESRQTYTEWAQSWTLGYSLTDRLSAYTEWFAFCPHAAETAVTEHYANGGFTFLITDDILWDVRAGRGLSEAADDYFVGMGLSLRFR